MVDNPFDPPEPDPEAAQQRVRPVYIRPPLDPSERVAGGFGAMNVIDRRAMDAGSWLAQQPANPNFLTRKSVYQTPMDPTYPAEYLPPENPEDFHNPLSLALGVRDINAYQNKQRLDEIAKEIEESKRRDQMAEYNKRLEAKRRKEAGAK